MIKKIPQKVLTQLHVKGDYKAKEQERYVKAYQNTFNVIKGTLNHFNHATPDSFEGFISLYFPSEKVEKASTDKDLASRLLALKSSTSVKQIRVLKDLNPWIMALLDLSIRVSED